MAGRRSGEGAGRDSLNGPTKTPRCNTAQLGGEVCCPGGAPGSLSTTIFKAALRPPKVRITAQSFLPLSTELKSIGEAERKTSQCRGSLTDKSSSPYFSTANHKRSISTTGKAETLTQMHLCLERK